MSIDKLYNDVFNPDASFDADNYDPNRITLYRILKGEHQGKLGISLENQIELWSPDSFSHKRLLIKDIEKPIEFHKQTIEKVHIVDIDANKLH